MPTPPVHRILVPEGERLLDRRDLFLGLLDEQLQELRVHFRRDRAGGGAAMGRRGDGISGSVAACVRLSSSSAIVDWDPI